MSPRWKPIDGDEIVPSPEAAAAAAAAAAAEDLHAAEASGAVEAHDHDHDHDQDHGDHHDHDGHDLDDGSDVAARGRGGDVDRRLLLISAILVVVIAQLVVGFLALGAINQLRDQTTTANGLQHCLINAQLNQGASSNPAAYRSAVEACLNK